MRVLGAAIGASFVILSSPGLATPAVFYASSRRDWNDANARLRPKLRALRSRRRDNDIAFSRTLAHHADRERRRDSRYYRLRALVRTSSKADDISAGASRGMKWPTQCRSFASPVCPAGRAPGPSTIARWRLQARRAPGRCDASRGYVSGLSLWTGYRSLRCRAR